MACLSEEYRQRLRVGFGCTRSEHVRTHHLGSPYAPQSALAPLRLCPPRTTFVLQANENPSASRPLYAPSYALAPLRLCPPSSTFVLQLKRKSLSFPRRLTRRRTHRSPLSRPSGCVLPVVHLYNKPTKTPQLPAPFAPSYALAPLRLCPPSSTFVLQLNEKPSASRAAVRAVVRAAVRSGAPPALSSQYVYFICTRNQPKSLSFPRRVRAAVRSRALRLCPPSTFVLQFNENPSASRAAVRAVVRAQSALAVRAVVRAAVRSRAPLCPPSTTTCTTIQRKSLSVPSRRTRRRTCRSSLSCPSGSVSVSQHYIGTTIQEKSLSVPRRRTRRRTCRSSLSRPSGSVLPVLRLYYNATKISQRPAPPYAPSHVPQSALAPLRLCPPSTIIQRHTCRSLLSRPSGCVLPVLHFYDNSTKLPQRPAPPHAPSHVPQSALAPLRLCPPSTYILHLY